MTTGATYTPPDHLWAHQREAFNFIAPLDRGMLAMDMGTGKSATAIALLEAWDCRRVLVLCPKSVIPVWPAQFQRFATHAWKAVPLDTGSMKQRARKMTAATGDRIVVILNYDVLPRGEMGKPIMDMKWDAVVYDESHKIKRAAGKTSLFCSRLSDRVGHRLALTGTPMPHSPLDIYAQFRAVDKSVFGASNTTFKTRYAVMGGFQKHEVVGYRNMEDLHRRMYTRTYRCRTADVLDLPEFIDVERYCELSPEELRIYKSMEKEFYAELEAGLITADNALVKLIRLAQITGGFCKLESGEIIATGTTKAKLFAEVLEELHSGYDDRQEPVVVFARFHNDLDLIHATAREGGFTTSELSGRRNDLAAWQAGETDILAVQLQSGGVGIDLTRARYCVYYSHEFSLGNYEQSRARVHRPGQTRAVTYIHLLAVKTIDVQIQRALAAKREVVKYVVDTMRGIGEMVDDAVDLARNIFGAE